MIVAIYVHTIKAYDPDGPGRWICADPVDVAVQACHGIAVC